jgi:hypothetical protein
MPTVPEDGLCFLGVAWVGRDMSGAQPTRAAEAGDIRMTCSDFDEACLTRARLLGEEDCSKEGSSVGRHLGGCGLGSDGRGALSGLVRSELADIRRGGAKGGALPADIGPR